MEVFLCFWPSFLKFSVPHIVLLQIFLRKNAQKLIPHSSCEGIMNSQYQSDIFCFAFYSFQIIPVCFLGCCYTPSWCPQAATYSDSRILVLIVYLFHPISWEISIFKFQLKFLIHSVELFETALQLLMPWAINQTYEVHFIIATSELTVYICILTNLIIPVFFILFWKETVAKRLNCFHSPCLGITETNSPL